MEKVLFINLRKYGDIFSSAHVISSYKYQNPNSQIHILVYKESERAAEIIKDVGRIHSIDRVKILTLNQNKLFNKSMAINTFTNNLSELLESTWDKVINLSNDHVSSYLISSLPHKEFFGVKIGKSGNRINSSAWANYLNEVVTSHPFCPINLHDIYHNLLSLKNKKTLPCVKILPENNLIATKNFNSIKAKYSTADKASIIGIQLRASDTRKELSTQTLCNLIEKLLKNPNYIPILLIAPIGEEINYANNINKKFNNSLYIVKSDFKATPSVLLNLDFLITPDTSIKHLADLTETPMLEISLGPSPMYKQGSVGEGNLILTQISSARKSIKNPSSFVLTDFNINASDITQALDYHFDNSKRPKLSKNITLYKVRKNQGITWPGPIAGDIDVNFEISQTMSQYYSLKLLKKEELGHVFPYIFKNYSHSEISKWINGQKMALTDTVKDLLKCIRTIRPSVESKTKAREFLVSLDQLLKHCDSQFLTGICVLIFRGEIESIEFQQIKENVNLLEKHLYSLKSDLQVLNSSITDLYYYITNQKDRRAYALRR